MDAQNCRQSWRADVKAVLRQLQQGPLLSDQQLQNLRITLQPPSSVPASQLARDHLPAFLETTNGQRLVLNLEFSRERAPDPDPGDRMSSVLTGTAIECSVAGLCDQIWGEKNFEIITNYVLSVQLGVSNKGRKLVAQYPTNMRVVHSKDGRRTCVIMPHQRACEMRLSAAEVFSLVALAIECRTENPVTPVYSVEVIAIYATHFRRLRARIPNTYIGSLYNLASSAADTLSTGFTVEQSPYINILSEDGMFRTMDAIFEPLHDGEDGDGH